MPLQVIFGKDTNKYPQWVMIVILGLALIIMIAAVVNLISSLSHKGGKNHNKPTVTLWPANWGSTYTLELSVKFRTLADKLHCNLNGSTTNKRNFEILKFLFYSLWPTVDIDMLAIIDQRMEMFPTKYEYTQIRWPDSSVLLFKRENGFKIPMDVLALKW